MFDFKWRYGIIIVLPHRQNCSKIQSENRISRENNQYPLIHQHSLTWFGLGIGEGSQNSNLCIS